ncbi:Hypothetical predicted protein [Olea europaea subsp. europaea]|uniref:Uncharacterized protein n=1 Tax=Olea europaea subsp. europaea TaxID=158383 RepID=A0A8S0TKQ9_OLEEU|nr:Hypothetical predicted protein [Olea europaea subsp. europaea]
MHRPFAKHLIWTLWLRVRTGMLASDASRSQPTMTIVDNYDDDGNLMMDLSYKTMRRWPLLSRGQAGQTKGRAGIQSGTTATRSNLSPMAGSTMAARTARECANLADCATCRRARVPRLALVALVARESRVTAARLTRGLDTRERVCARPRAGRRKPTQRAGGLAGRVARPSADGFARVAACKHSRDFGCSPPAPARLPKAAANSARPRSRAAGKIRHGQDHTAEHVRGPTSTKPLLASEPRQREGRRQPVVVCNKRANPAWAYRAVVCVRACSHVKRASCSLENRRARLIETNSRRGLGTGATLTRKWLHAPACVALCAIPDRAREQVHEEGLSADALTCLRVESRETTKTTRELSDYQDRLSPNACLPACLPPERARALPECQPEI